mgnify:FL=1
MSKKPAYRGGHRKGKDDLKFADQNKLLRQGLELDEKELEERKKLDANYRDRAAERRAGLIEGEEEAAFISDMQTGAKIFTKGLDFGLLEKELQAEEGESIPKKPPVNKPLGNLMLPEHLQAKLIQASETIKKLNSSNPGDVITKKLKKMNTATIKDPMAVKLYQYLLESAKEEVKPSTSSIFDGNTVYEFDLNPQFGKHLPKIVTRRGNKDRIDTGMFDYVDDDVISALEELRIYKENNGVFPRKKEEPKPVAKAQASDDSDDDAIFKDVAKDFDKSKLPKLDIAINKGIPAQNGAKAQVPEEKKMEIETDKPKDLKAIFNDLESSIIPEEGDNADVLKMLKGREEKKIKTLADVEDDSYMECFQAAPLDFDTIKAMKLKVKEKKEGQQQQGHKKMKAKELESHYQKVAKAMEKKKGEKK